MYTYKDFKDKSLKGVGAELSKGLADIAFYFETTLGIPLEIFESMLEEKCPTNLERLALYMRYRNEKPEIFR